MTADIRGTTSVYGIIGFPVTHSRSPLMQNAAFRAAGIDGVYVPFQVAPDRLADAIRGMRALGIAGFNVTIPHKTAVMPLLDEISAEAAMAGAVNTVINREGRLIGYNTDGAGLIKAVEQMFACAVKGQRVTVLGAGGAARGAVVALCRAGAGTVTVVNRTMATAEELVESLLPHCQLSELRAVGSDQLPRLMSSTDLLINATSIGMRGEEIDGLPLALLPKAAKVYDMVYRSGSTPLVQSANELGFAAVDGLSMLVAQGELAFACWIGFLPPAGVMAASVGCTSSATDS